MRPNTPEQKSAMLGIGLDNKDGHKRITKGDNFMLVGGSEETHERMTETAIKINAWNSRTDQRNRSPSMDCLTCQSGPGGPFW